MAQIFKVKFADTLRRFNVPIRDDELGPGWTFSELDAKIREMFSVPLSSELVITYKDTDRDIVTLADDQDLIDACMVQRLNPLRLEVNALAAPQESEIESATIGIKPVMVENQPAITIPPAIAIPPVTTVPSAFTAIDISSVKVETPAITIGPAVTISPLKVETPAITIPRLTEFSVANLLERILPESNLQIIRNVLKRYPPSLFATVPARLLVETLETFLKKLTTTSTTSKQQATPLASNLNQDRPSVAPSPPAVEYLLESVLGGAFPESTAEAVRQVLNCYPPDVFATVLAGVLAEALDAFLRNLTGYGANLAAAEQPATLMESSFAPLQSCAHQGSGRENASPRGQPSKPDCPPPIFHEYVVCDGCGITPIVGPRYKSMKKQDYDLCSSCFLNMGNGADYLKVDRPVNHKTHCHYSPALRMRMEEQSTRSSPSTALFLQEPSSLRPKISSQNHSLNGSELNENANGKLDSQFLNDGAIVDGTEFSPGTTFTKIWQMKNVGTLPWPQQTKLVHIDGDILTSSDAVSLELPEGGLACGEKINISVDLTAPESNGRHVSHWCLSAPSGQRFGQRVWTLIKVVPSGEEMPQVQEFAAGQSIGEHVSVLEGSAEVQGEVATYAKSSLGPLIDEIGSAESSSSASPVTDSEDQQAEDIDELDDFSVVEKALGNNTRSGESVVEYDFVQLLELEPAFEMAAKESLDGVPELQLGGIDKNGFYKPALNEFGPIQKDKQAFLQEIALEKLKSMGFVQRDLNIEILEKNKYNLQQTMNDLVTSTKWDQILKDLEEMGFDDMQTNCRLLFKNEGSMKQVVKELVEIEKQVSRGKGKEKAA